MDGFHRQSQALKTGCVLCFLFIGTVRSLQKHIQLLASRWNPSMNTNPDVDSGEHKTLWVSSYSFISKLVAIHHICLGPSCSRSPFQSDSELLSSLNVNQKIYFQIAWRSVMRIPGQPGGHCFSVLREQDAPFLCWKWKCVELRFVYLCFFFLFFFFLPPKEGHCPDSYATFDRNSTALLEQLCCWVWSNNTALDWSPCLNGTCAGARQPRPSHNGFFASHLPSFPLFMMCFLRQRLEPWGVPLPVFCRKSPLEREKVCMSRTHQRACFHLHSAKKQMSNSL